MFNKYTRNLLIALVGAHTILWVLMELMRPATGGVDQSPAFVLVLALYYLDAPTRWLIESANEPRGFGLFFLFATLQWTTISVALGLAYSQVKSGFLRQGAATNGS